MRAITSLRHTICRQHSVILLEVNLLMRCQRHCIKVRYPVNEIQQALRQIFEGRSDVRVLDTAIPAIEAYPRAATQGLPVHRVENRRPTGRSAPSALETIRAVACELLPQWREAFSQVDGKTPKETGRVQRP